MVTDFHLKYARRVALIVSRDESKWVPILCFHLKQHLKVNKNVQFPKTFFKAR